MIIDYKNKELEDELYATLSKKEIVEDVNYLLRYFISNTENNRMSEREQIEIIKCLIKCGADVNIADEEYDETPLLCACKQNKYVVATYLIQQEQADVNYVNRYDMKTALLWAVRAENYGLCKLLIDNGANVNACMPIYTAIKFENIDIIKLLIDNGADFSRRQYYMLKVGVDNRDEDFIKYLVENGVDINARSLMGITILSYYRVMYAEGDAEAPIFIDFLKGLGAKE